MKATPIFEFPFPEEEDAPDGPAQIGDLGLSLEERLAVIELLLGTPAVPAAPAPGDLVIVNGTSDPVYKAVTGDVAFNQNGVVTIGNLKVTAAKLAALAVETGKLAELAVTAPKIATAAVISRTFKPTHGVIPGAENFNLPVNEWQDFPGGTLILKPEYAARLDLTAIFCFEATAGTPLMRGTVTVNGGAEDPEEARLSGPSPVMATVAQVYELSLKANETVKIQMRVQNSPQTVGATARTRENSRLKYLLASA